MNTEYIGDVALYNAVDTLKRNIESGKYDEELKQEIYLSIIEYVTGERQPLTIDAINYLVKGWWLSQHGV